MRGTIEHIHIAEGAGGPTRSLASVEALAGVGLAGDRYARREEFWIGGVLARATELCEPCTHLVALTGKPLIKPLAHRGGLRADLLTSGRISVGDRVEVREPAARQPSH